MNKQGTDWPPEKNKEWLAAHKKCPDCGKWMIEWSKNQEDKIKFPDKEKPFIWRCGCGHRKEHPEMPISREDQFKKTWEETQKYAKGDEGPWE